VPGQPRGAAHAACAAGTRARCSDASKQ
jgi:hypothetical protein